MESIGIRGKANEIRINVYRSKGLENVQSVGSIRSVYPLGSDEDFLKRFVVREPCRTAGILDFQCLKGMFIQTESGSIERRS